MNRLIVLRFPLAILASLPFFAPAHAGPYEDVILGDNPVGYWRFEDVEDLSGVAVDSATSDASTNGQGSQDGAYVSGPTAIAGPIRSEDPLFPEFNDGRPTSNMAVDFNGNSGYVEILDTGGVLGPLVDANPDITAWSYELWWLNQTEVQGANHVLAKGSNPTVTYFKRVSPNSEWGILNGGTNRIATFRDPTLGVWTHVVGIVERVDAFSAQGRVFVNGKLVPESEVVFNGTTDDDPSTETEPLTIGAMRLDVGFYVSLFDGAVDEVAVYNYALSNSQIMDHFMAAKAPPGPEVGDWISPTSGDWNNPFNWFDEVIPDTSVGATFGTPERAPIDSPATIFTNTEVAVKSFDFGTDQEVVVMGVGGVTLDSDDDAPAVTVHLGSHQFQLPVTLADPTTITTADNTKITFNNRLDLAGNTLTETGTGMVEVNGQVVGGTISMSSGSLGGSGSIAGSVINSGGTLAPGNSAGSLAIGADYTQEAEGTLAIEIGGRLAGENYDVLRVAGAANLEGEIDVSLLDGFSPALGDAFDILTASIIHDEGLSLAGDSPGFVFNVVTDPQGGQALQLVAVPEPTTGILACLGALALMRTRQRARNVASCLAVATLILLSAVQPVCAGPYVDAVMADNPVGYWRFEETDVSDGMTAFDSAPLQGNNDGIFMGEHSLMGGAIPSEPGSLAIRNPGLNDIMVAIADDGDTAFTDGAMAATDFTFEGWLRPEFADTGDFDFPPNGDCCGHFISRGLFFRNSTQFVQQHDTGYHAGFNGGVTGDVARSSPVEANVWKHVVATFDSDEVAGEVTISIYINGQLAMNLDDPATPPRENPVTNSGLPNDNSSGFLPSYLTIGGLPFGPPSDPFSVNIGQTWHGGIDEVAYYDYVLPENRISEHYIASCPPDPANCRDAPGTWVSVTSGDWNTAGNWFEEIPSTSVGATFGETPFAPVSIFTGQDVVVKSTTFDNDSAYVIGGSGRVMLDADNDAAAIDVMRGSHQFQSAFTFVDDAAISVAPGAQLDFHNEIDLGTGSRTINVTGGGRININNDLAVGSGVWNVQSGTTLGGHGTAPGSVNSVGGAVAPGTSVGELAIGADFTMDASSTLEIEIGGLVAGDEHDVLNVIGAASLAGDLNIVLTGGFSPTNGDQFDVVVADSISGSVNLTGDSAGFSASIVGGGGDVTDGRDLLQIMRTNPAEISTWESQFGLSGGGGQILRLAFGGESQSAVPEPTTALLCLVAQSLLIVRRPRS